MYCPPPVCLQWMAITFLPALKAALAAAGFALRADEPLEGYDRIFVDDPFGNRIELLEPARS